MSTPMPRTWTAAHERFHVSAAIERLKTSRSSNALTFEGYASVFNTPIDTYTPTIIKSGAFTATLADPEQRRRMRLLYGHDDQRVIGRLTELREDQRGLYVKGTISETPLGLEVYTLLKDGALDEMSIGFDPIEFYLTREPGQDDDTRNLTAVRLWEISIVAFAANREARVASVHRRSSRTRRVDLAADLRDLDLLCLEHGIIPPGLQ